MTYSVSTISQMIIQLQASYLCKKLQSLWRQTVVSLIAIMLFVSGHSGTSIDLLLTSIDLQKYVQLLETVPYFEMVIMTYLASTISQMIIQLQGSFDLCKKRKMYACVFNCNYAFCQQSFRGKHRFAEVCPVVRNCAIY